jgi:hypothetical protein
VSEFRARIGRIRMKNGGADVRVLNREPINPDGEDWRGKIVANARTISEQGSLAGFVVVGFFEDGTYSIGYRYDPPRCPVPRTLIPAWIEDMLRPDMLMNVEAREVFNEMFEWVE